MRPSNNLENNIPSNKYCRVQVVCKKVQVHSSLELLLFKASAFLQIFFPRNLVFQQVLRVLVFLNGKSLTFLYLLPYLFLY